MGRHAQNTHWQLAFCSVSHWIPQLCFSLEHWIPQLLLLVIMPIGAMELQHSPHCQGHKFSMQNLTLQKTNVDTKSSIILAVCKMLCGTQCADCWCTLHGCRCYLTIISNSTSKDSIFYTRSTNFLRTGMKSMNRRYSGNCLLSGPVLKLALCQQRWNKAEILESLLKDVAYSQQIPLDKMVEVI
jgi:hypothetical protein